MFNPIIITISSIILLLLIRYLYNKNHKKKYLVFSSIGDKTNVQSWVSGPEKKNFDLVLYYYGDNAIPVTNSDLLVVRKGLKFENFHHYLKNNDISHYQAIWVPDDDMVINTGSINKMFELFSKYKLKLAQPSFGEGSRIPWKITRNNPDYILRYTNFIENNVAIFSTDTISLFMETFSDARTGFGVDFIWPMLLNFPENKIAVIDAVSCQHPITGYSALDEVVPRELHKVQGAELLIKYGLLPKFSQWQIPYEPKEYSRIVRSI